MTFLLAQHLLSVAMLLLSVGFTVALLEQRRPTGTTIAWILAVVLVPYVAIPFYLAFGGRKFRRRASSKAQLRMGHGPVGDIGANTVRVETPRALCAIDWLMDGVGAYEAVLAEIERAKFSIRILTFVIGDDETGREVINALARRAAEGLDVCLLIDDLLFFRAPHDHLARLGAAGGRVARFMPLLHLPFRGRSNLRNHRKLAVFDGTLAIIGGMNLATEYMGPVSDPRRWCDFMARISGPAVATLDRVFCADWFFASKEALSPCATALPVPNGVPARALPSGPDDPADTLYDSLLQQLFLATERVWIATPYFVPDELLTKALELAIRRGVDVRIVVPARSNHGLADHVAAPALRSLATTGASVFRFAPVMLHAKAVLIDRSTVCIGSANFDMRSFFLDYEIALQISDVPQAIFLAAWFETLFAQSSAGPPHAGRVLEAFQRGLRLVAPLV